MNSLEAFCLKLESSTCTFANISLRSDTVTTWNLPRRKACLGVGDFSTHHRPALLPGRLMFPKGRATI